MHEGAALLEPDDLLDLPDGEHYELIDGRPVEKPMGAESDRISVNIAVALSDTVKKARLGYVFGSSTGFRCFPSRPGLVRKPDASFVARGRFVDEKIPTGNIEIAPDLAVEVISPNDLADELEEKVWTYLAAGIKLIWIVSPAARTIRVIRSDNTCVILGHSEMLSGDHVVPGFSCSVADLFA